MSFKKVDSRTNLPEIEEKILDFWIKNRIFEKSIENRKEVENYSFYDGPPFATGTPHYGHLVVSTIKDVIPRYFTMKGYKVERRWGWDCQGLPIENIAEQSLGIKNKKEIEELGVEKFNNVCRSKVLEYVAEWEKVIPRLGRWVDMKDAYKTMDLDYMESVWWVFKQLYDRQLIYEGYRSMYICPRCETTLSQTEVSEGYKIIKDLSLVAKFELLYEVDKKQDDLFKGQKDAPIYLLAWTTTPWTLIGNVALAVGETIDYVQIKLKEKDEYYILAKDRLGIINEEYEIIDEYRGKKLIGAHYRPLYSDYFNKTNLENIENGWQVYGADFVNTQEGTGIVHIAPAFGEDDLNLAKKLKLPFIQHIGMDGIIKDGVKNFAGMNVKDKDDPQKTDVAVLKDLANRDLLYSKAQYEHSYPHCWRCETPLLNYATSSWFVAITRIKDDAIKLAEKISWFPSHMKKGRFGKWLEGARDWSISRQRYWASVIPIWRCKCGEIVVVGQISQLEKLSGEKITDLHKDKIDKIIFPCSKCKGQMHRVEDVLDTWFDSGSMPYAQLHYPFENKEKFEKTFPAQFVGESQDQTRAWFYYMHTIATAIKNTNAFENVVVNGIVLAEDGKKMSKHLKNFPDPIEVINKYGADALRIYLLSSPVMQAENLNFSEKDLSVVSSGFIRMLWNSYSFFTLYANIDNWQKTETKKISDNILDEWIVSELNLLIKNVTDAMKGYELTKATRCIVSFTDSLSNWYIRRSRQRFQSTENNIDKDNAYKTLHYVLVELSKILAPFAPFITEEIYKNLTNKTSVHLDSYPEFEDSLINEKLNNEMVDLRKIVEQGLSIRTQLGPKYRVRQPLASASINKKIDNKLIGILQDELNIKKIDIVEKQKDLITIDTNLTDQLLKEGIARELLRTLQDLRKKASLNAGDKVTIYYNADKNIYNILTENKKMLEKHSYSTLENGDKDFDIKIEKYIDGQKIIFGLSK